MKMDLLKYFAGLCLLLAQVTSYAAGTFFNVSSAGAPANVSITLCLNGSGPLSCQTFNVSALSLTISTTIPNHVYPGVGIKVNTPGYSLAALGVECTPVSSGFCNFATSDTAPKMITLTTDPSTFMTTVGYYVSSSHTYPLSYSSSNNGVTWNLSAPQAMLPSNAVSGALANAACDSSRMLCTVVGTYNTGSHALPLSYVSTNAGSTWLQSSQMPLLPVGASSAFLEGVSCNSSGALCVAVGSYSSGSTSFPVTYTSSNGGKSWAISSQLPALPLGATDASLFNVSCDSTGKVCTAVGRSYNGSTDSPVSYTSGNGGSTWTISQQLPALPSGAVGGYTAGVACSSSGLLCISVGTYNNGSYNIPIIYSSSNGGVTWKISYQGPIFHSLGSNILYDVTCNSAGSVCNAVGSYQHGGNSYPLTYVTTNGGVSWLATMPTPPANTVFSYMSKVICNSAGNQCSATGTYYNGSHDLPLSYTSTNGGQSWALTPQQPMIPAGATDGIINNLIS